MDFTRSYDPKNGVTNFCISISDFEFAKTNKYNVSREAHVISLLKRIYAAISRDENPDRLVPNFSRWELIKIILFNK